MSTVELTDNEWGQVMSIIGDAPWKQANPLLMKIGQQLQAQALAGPGQPAGEGLRVSGNGQEINHG